MKIEGTYEEGIFLERPNRFIAVVLIEGKRQISHVPNTGRLKELLVPGVEVLLRKFDNTNRKTSFGLIFVKKDDIWVSIDSANIPNKIVYEDILENRFGDFLNGGIIKREYKVKNSRLDFALLKDDYRFLLEVKGVTLVEEGRAYFPDAPTTRGTKHVYELADELDRKTRTGIIFLVQRDDAEVVIPNHRTDIEFAKALKYAYNNGVELFAYSSLIDLLNMEIRVTREIPVLPE